MDKDILDGFKEESSSLLKELTTVVERLEAPSKDFPTELLREFSQKIDRIMGAAKTLLMLEPGHPGLERMGKIAELCKGLGYVAAEKKALSTIPIFAAFWADTLEVLDEILEAIEDAGATERISKQFGIVLQKRLEWLSGKIGTAAAPGSASPGGLDVEAMLKSFGL